MGAGPGDDDPDDMYCFVESITSRELIEGSRNAWQEAVSLTALSEDHRVHGQMLIKIGSEHV
jgi:hypothetical protein